RLRRELELEQYCAFLRERGGSHAKVRWDLAVLCTSLFRETVRGRLSMEDLRLRWRRLVRGPLCFFTATGLILTLAFLATGLGSGIRTVYATLPYPEPDRLVSCYQVHFLSLSWGVQSRYVSPWQEGSKTLEGLAAHQVWRYRTSIEGLGGSIQGARVTPEFFQLLGVQPIMGSSFAEQDRAAGGKVLLSHNTWRRRFGADPGVVGRRITLDGQEMQIAGVLPAGFWFRSRELEVWTLLPDLSRADPATRLVGTVGRLRPGVGLAEARSELEAIAWRSSRFRGGAFRVVPLSQSLRPSLQFINFSFVVGSLLAAGIACVQFLRSWRGRRHGSGELWRYWLFFAAKPTVLLAVTAFVGVELAARNVLALHAPYRFALSLLIDWASVLAALLLLRWAILDQSRRCPVCVRRLGMAVTSGSWGSSFIEPASTELLCDQGHGALRVSNSHSTLGEIRRWVALEDSWRELTTTGKG
ncbi:MAG TPA: ABC transporter permease, partial [Bryobacteraceae bacterium]|nr:ABC transporter permease [Bryobacteraceae bacterium]